MPKPLMYSILIVIVLAMIPPALIAWARTTTSDKPRIHIIQDMDSQAKLKTQSVGPRCDLRGRPGHATGDPRDGRPRRSPRRQPLPPRCRERRVGDDVS
jgi:hypothetical protein